MTTKVIVEVEAHANHNVTVKGAYPSLGGGYQDTTELKPGEKREFWVHSSRALVIDEGSPASAAA